MSTAVRNDARIKSIVVRELRAAGQVDETAPPVIRKIHRRGHSQPDPLRSLDEIRTDILALEKETEGLLAQILRTDPKPAGQATLSHGLPRSPC